MALVAPAPQQPRTRGECVDAARPCPWVRCRYHLGEDRPQTCALDVAERGGLEEGDVARLLHVSGSRIGQIVQEAVAKLRRAAPPYGDFLPELEPKGRPLRARDAVGHPHPTGPRYQR